MYFSKFSITHDRTRQSLLILIGLAFFIPETIALSYEVTPVYLTQKADLVILGRVKAKETEVRPLITGTTNGVEVRYRTVKTVVTMYKVKLDKSFKQKLTDSTISILTLGGTLPGRGSWTDSKYFDLEVGEKFVAFLAYDKRNEAWRVYAGSQGIYRIQEDSSDTDNPFVVSAYTGHFVPRGVPSNPEQERQVQLRLQDLLGTIKSSSEE